MEVEVDETRALSGGVGAGHRADLDRAVAAEHDRAVAGADRRLDAPGHLARRLGDAGGVLGAPMLAIGGPAAERDVAEVGVRGEPRLAQGARRLLLARGESAEARRRADQGVRHNR